MNFGEISKRVRFRPATPDQQAAHNALIGGIADQLHKRFPDGVPTDIQKIAQLINAPGTALNFGDIAEAIKRANALEPKTVADSSLVSQNG